MVLGSRHCTAGPQEQQPVAARVSHSLIHGVIEAGVGLAAPEVQLVVVAAQQVERAIGRTAITDDEFERCIGLLEHAAERPFERGDAILDHDDNAKERPARRGRLELAACARTALDAGRIG
ncbi:MAG: hypothetical protein NTY53_16560 [Kiritimatiellaeota bacterium]|nr:hypothetical protein [Kiritimatiellota bacterium]